MTARHLGPAHALLLGLNKADLEIERLEIKVYYEGVARSK